MSHHPGLYLDSKLFHRPSRDDRDTTNLGTKKAVMVPDPQKEDIEPNEDDLSVSKASAADLDLVRKEKWDDGTVVTHRKSPFPSERKPVVPSKLHDTASVESVPIASLRGSQSTVAEHGVQQHLDKPPSSSDLPMVYRTPEGTNHIADGHHRLAAAHLRGDKTAQVRVVDLGKTKKASEAIPGGLASGKKPEDFDPVKLKEGIKVEREHTPRDRVAREISMDHLTEDPQYYRKLKTIESSNTKKAIEILKAKVDVTGRLEGKFKVSVSDMIRQLNRIVSAEYSQWMRWYHYGIVLRGHARDALAEEFFNHAEEELGHAENVAMRVIALGGYPATSMEHPLPLHKAEEILQELLSREQHGMQLYREVHALCGENEGTRQVIEGNIGMEQHHIDELWRYLKHPEMIKAGAEPPSGESWTGISDAQRARQYKHSFQRDTNPGISGGGTPDLPERGRDWHGTVPGVKDEPQKTSNGIDKPPVNLVDDEPDSGGPTKTLKNKNQEAAKALAGAPRFSPGPFIPPPQKEFLKMRGWSDEEIEGGRTMSSRLRAEFNKWLTSTVQKSIARLQQ